MSGAQGAESCEIIGRQWPDPTFPLNGLNHDRYHVCQCRAEMLYRGKIVGGHPEEAVEQRAKTLADFGVAGSR